MLSIHLSSLCDRSSQCPELFEAEERFACPFCLASSLLLCSLRRLLLRAGSLCLALIILPCAPAILHASELAILVMYVALFIRSPDLFLLFVLALVAPTAGPLAASGWVCVVAAVDVARSLAFGFSSPFVDHSFPRLVPILDADPG